MSEEPKGPPKIDVEEILSQEASMDEALQAEDLEVVGMEPRAVGRPEPEEGAPPGIEQLADLQERHLRLRADFDNYRKRVEREKAAFSRRAAADLLRELLPVLDNLERALGEGRGEDGGAFREGVALIYRQAMEVLRRAGLEPIDAVGNPFDPNCHEAMERRATEEYPDQTVMEELQKGYRFQGQLLRPALVRVACRPDAAALDEPVEG